MIPEQDLRIDIYRNAGAYGTLQDVAVRITHMPSGLQATSRHEISSRAAKDKAMAELEEKFSNRFCPRHYQPTDAWSPFFHQRRQCLDCEQEEQQAWIQDVQQRLEFALAAASHGMTVTWRPSEDTPELLVARMMELNNAPATLTETVAWVRKYIH